MGVWFGCLALGFWLWGFGSGVLALGFGSGVMRLALGVAFGGCRPFGFDLKFEISDLRSQKNLQIRSPKTSAQRLRKTSRSALSFSEIPLDGDTRTGIMSPET